MSLISANMSSNLNQKTLNDRTTIMTNALEQALKRLPAKPVPTGLFAGIQLAIQQEERWMRSLRRWVFLFSAGLSSLVLFVSVAGQSLVVELSQSAFFTYLQLIWSDTDVLYTHGQDIAFSLLESLPVVNLIIGLLGLFFVLGLLSLGLQFRSYRSQHSLSLS